MVRFIAWLAALSFAAPALADCSAESGQNRVSLL